MAKKSPGKKTSTKGGSASARGSTRRPAAKKKKSSSEGATSPGTKKSSAKKSTPKKATPPKSPKPAAPKKATKKPSSGSAGTPDAKKPARKKTTRKKAPKKPLDLPTFIERLGKAGDVGRLLKATKMLRASRFELFSEITDDHLIGVVKSQTDASLVYSCRLGADGSFSCCTQNLFPCGGLRGALCKHLLVLVIGLCQAGQTDPDTMKTWVDASRKCSPALDKDLMSETFLRYKGAEAGEVDWRPTETIPEDFYAL